MQWLTILMHGASPAKSILALGLVVALGMALARIKIKGVSVGVAGVLFAGIILGELGIQLDHQTLDFAKEFGLVLFVYSIGMQVGPSFFSSFRRQGLLFNALAGSNVLLGVALTVAFHYLFMLPAPISIGMLSGAVTNTPSLGAAQQALRDAMVPDWDLAGKAYALAYPFGVTGIILALLIVRKLFRVDLAKEVTQFESSQEGNDAPENINLVVFNPQIAGQTLSALYNIAHPPVVASRLLRAGQVLFPTPDTRLRLGDTLHLVGSKAGLENVRLLVGDPVDLDVRTVTGNLGLRVVRVTHAAVLDRPLAALDFPRKFGVNLTRIRRSGLEFVPQPAMSLQFGDTVTLVGEEKGLSLAETMLGNSLKALEHPDPLPVFLGLALGVLLGSLPFSLPGVPGTVKLGLAGGTLVAAIALSRLGKVGPVVFYTPHGALSAMREMGIAMFLACVGLASGHGFFASLAGEGIKWMALGACLTLVPLLVTAWVGRKVYGLNFISLCGILTGGMTDPPALAFAGTMTGSSGPALVYASVYPFTMLLRVVSAQLLAIFLI